MMTFWLKRKWCSNAFISQENIDSAERRSSSEAPQSGPKLKTFFFFFASKIKNKRSHSVDINMQKERGTHINNCVEDVCFSTLSGLNTEINQAELCI